VAKSGTWGDPGNRSLAEGVKALKRHIRLLREYRKRAFEESDYDYLGEIVGKLRLLVCTDSGLPLLLELMDVRRFDHTFPAEQLFRLLPGEGPRGNPTLRKWLNKYAALEGITLGLGVGRMTNAGLISEWAQTMGAAHEGPTFPNSWLLGALHTANDFAMPDSPPAHVQWLQAVTGLVLEVADLFLRSLESEVFPAEYQLPERRHAASLRVRLFLANYVEPRSILLDEFGGIVSHRIYASGIGLDVIQSRPIIVGVGAIVDVSYDAFDIEHRLIFKLVNARGEQVTTDPAGEKPAAIAFPLRSLAHLMPLGPRNARC
jgi:hypothetical protein